LDEQSPPSFCLKAPPLVALAATAFRLAHTARRMPKLLALPLAFGPDPLQRVPVVGPLSGGDEMARRSVLSLVDEGQRGVLKARLDGDMLALGTRLDAERSLRGVIQHRGEVIAEQDALVAEAETALAMATKELLGRVGAEVAASLCGDDPGVIRRMSGAARYPGRGEKR